MHLPAARFAATCLPQTLRCQPPYTTQLPQLPPDVAGGTAIAAAMLEELLSLRVTGVFASHLHLLQSLPLAEDGLSRWRMETGARAPAAWSPLCCSLCLFI